MSENADAGTPDDQKQGPEFRITIQVTESKTGDLGMQVMGQAVRLVECRKMLEWALNRVNDEIHAETTKNILADALEKKARANGFRPMKVFDIFKK